MSNTPLFSLHARSSGDRAPLRIGLLLDSFTLPRWQADILEDIENCDFADIRLAVVNGAERRREPARRGLLASVWNALRKRNTRKGLLYILFTRFDRRYNGAEVADLFEPVDCAARLAGVPSLTVTPLGSGFVHRFKDEDVAAIKAHDLDVLLRFGFNIIRGDILDSARYGVWSYHHGDNDYYRGGPAGFWEMAEGHPVTGVMLQVLTSELDAGRVLCKAHVSTAMRGSLLLNRDDQYRAGVSFVIQKLHELHERGWEFIESRMLGNAFAGKRAIYRKPTNAEMLRFLGPALAVKAWRRVTGGHRSYTFWNIAIRRAGATLDPTSSAPTLQGFQWLEAEPGHFRADPFLLQHDGSSWLFFEDYVYEERRAGISCARVTANGGISDVQRVLTRPYHLSYPFVFRDGDEIFMVPESHANETVELYRAERFPSRWRLEKILLRGLRAVDTTIWKQDGLYWFFVPVLTGKQGYQLLLFHADSLTGEWRHHPASPLCMDVRRARSAGAIFSHRDRLIRPAQDCSVSYGRAIRFHEIVTLNTREYEERLVGQVEAGWSNGLRKTHTYNRVGDLEVLDGGWTRRGPRPVAAAPAARDGRGAPDADTVYR